MKTGMTYSEHFCSTGPGTSQMSLGFMRIFPSPGRRESSEVTGAPAHAEDHNSLPSSPQGDPVPSFGLQGYWTHVHILRNIQTHS